MFILYEVADFDLDGEPELLYSTEYAHMGRFSYIAEADNDCAYPDTWTNQPDIYFSNEGSYTY